MRSHRHGGSRRRVRRDGTIALAAALLVLALAGRPAAAQQAQVIAEGKQDYDETCAACHGPEGRGDGPMAGLLVLPPSDLTRVAKDAGGAFPFWRVYRIIEGGETVKGHETFQMPVLGNRFRRDEAKPGYLPAHVRILTLTHFIESLQVD